MKLLVLTTATLGPAAILVAALWLGEKRMRNHGARRSRRLLLYAAASFLAALFPAWLMAEMNWVLRHGGDLHANPAFREREIVRTMGSLTLGFTAIGALSLMGIDRLRTNWLAAKVEKAWLNAPRDP